MVDTRSGSAKNIPQIPLAQVPRIPVASTGRFGFCPSPRPLHKDKAKATPSQVATQESKSNAAESEAKAHSKIQVLADDLDPNYEPTEEEVLDYAAWLGIDLEAEKHLLWLAREGLKAPCPEPWKPCQTEGGELFYFNFKTGDSVWDHPCDVQYKKLLQECREQGKARSSPVPSLCLTSAQRQAAAVTDLFRSPRKLTARVKPAAASTGVEQNLPSSGTSDGKLPSKIKVLEEEMCPDYEPPQALIEEYAEWLGMDLKADRELLWIARQGLMEPCPEHWKPCMTEDEEIFYFNFKTGESIWDHPCDKQYKALYQEHKALR